MKRNIVSLEWKVPWVFRGGKKRERERRAETEKEGEKERRIDALYLSMVGRQREKERARRGERAPSPTHPPALLLYPPYLLTELTNGWA